MDGKGDCIFLSLFSGAQRRRKIRELEKRRRQKIRTLKVHKKCLQKVSKKSVHIKSQQKVSAKRVSKKFPQKGGGRWGRGREKGRGEDDQ